MKIHRLIVNTKNESYPILIGSQILPNLPKIINKYSIDFQKCLILVDKNVPKKQIDILRKKLKYKNSFFYFIKATETNKNQNNTNKILEILLKKIFQDKIV